MGIASFVIGLICLLLSPFLSIFLILPAILALLLGIIDTIIKAKKKQSKGLAIAGIVLSTLALIVSISVIVLLYTFSGTIWNGIQSIAESIQDELQPSTINATTGETVTIGDIKVTLKSVNTNFTDFSEFAYVPENTKILKADFEFENTGDYTNAISSSYFRCYADQFSCDSFYYLTEDFYETIEPSRKSAISVYYEIPEDAELIEIEYNPTLASEKIVFSVI